MLGGDAVHERNRLVEVAHRNQRAGARERGADDVAPLQRRQQLFNGLGHLLGEFFIQAEQDGLRRLVVLGLGKEVHRHPLGIGLAVAHDDDLGRPGNHVDAHNAEHQALGSGDVDISRSDNLIDPGDGLRAVRQRRHRLRAADGKDAVHTAQVGGGEHHLVQLPVRRRHHHDNLGHVGDLGRNRVHQHRRWIRRLAAGHIESDTLKRRDLLAEQRAVGLGIAPGFGSLTLVVGADALGGVRQRLVLFLGERARRLAQAYARNLKLGHRHGLAAIELAGIVEQRGVAARAHVVENRAHARLDLGVGGLRARAQLRERGVEARFGGFQYAQVDVHLRITQKTFTGLTGFFRIYRIKT